MNIEKKEPEKKSLIVDYWQTLIDHIQDDPDIPLTNRRKIMQGVPLSMADHTLIIQHPEAEWCNGRFGRVMTNMFQGLVPGGKIVFTGG